VSTIAGECGADQHNTDREAAEAELGEELR